MWSVTTKLIALCIFLTFSLQAVVAPPVTANKKEDSSKENEIPEGTKKQDWDIGLEYNRYLQEVVQALESDPEFREKLEKAEVADIRTGKIASELEFVNHNVRSKLDELKRQELERLRHLAIKEFELSQQNQHMYPDGSEHQGSQEHDEQQGDPRRLRLPYHLDHKNPHSFETEDLRKLIVQTTKDLEEADRKRREEFKEYEMQKEFEKQQQLNLLDDENKKKLEKTLEEQENKHRNHPSLHHPGSKPQLEQVWEEQDHMNPDDFNPKTFFHLHDLDGNGFWDTDEVKTLFQKELDKMYDPNAPEDDMRERREEMERMREHVFNETDVNRDKLISYQEFLEQTKKTEFEQDPGWEGLDHQKVYSDAEYQAFEMRRQAEVQRMIEQGLLPPQPVMHLPPGIDVPPHLMQPQHGMPHHQLPPHAQQPIYHPQGGAPVHQGQQYQYQVDPQHHGQQQQQQLDHHAQQQAMHHAQQQQQYHAQQQGVHAQQQGVHAQQQGVHAQPQGVHSAQGTHTQQDAPVYHQGAPVFNQQGQHQQGVNQQHHQQQQGFNDYHPQAPVQNQHLNQPVNGNQPQGARVNQHHETVSQGVPVQQGFNQHQTAPHVQNNNVVNPHHQSNNEHQSSPPPPSAPHQSNQGGVNQQGDGSQGHNQVNAQQQQHSGENKSSPPTNRQFQSNEIPHA